MTVLEGLLIVVLLVCQDCLCHSLLQNEDANNYNDVDQEIGGQMQTQNRSLNAESQKSPSEEINKDHVKVIKPDHLWNDKHRRSRGTVMQSNPHRIDQQTGHHTTPDSPHTGNAVMRVSVSNSPVTIPMDQTSFRYRERNHSLPDRSEPNSHKHNQVIYNTDIRRRYKTHYNCVLKPSKRSFDKFRHLVYYEHLNFVHLNLIPGKHVGFLAKNRVVEKTKWVWTFYGREGALEFLRWPAEFGIWSMGLLDVFTSTIDITLERVKGNCSALQVGKKRTDNEIAQGLVQLAQNLMNFSHEYESKCGPSFFCYKERMFIHPTPLYVLCKNIMCPLESLQYKCCNNFFDSKTVRRHIDCSSRFEYDSLWWIIPIVVAAIVFASCPLVIMAVASKFSETPTPQLQQHPANHAINETRCSNYIYLDDKYPLTLSGTLFSPILTIIGRISNWTRLGRFFIPFTSLSIIALQILLDYLYLYDMVLMSIQKGVFLGFRSIIAGFSESSKYFMEYLGGPYVALAIYLGLTCISISFPSCLPSFLERGVPRERHGGMAKTVLLMDLKTIGQFGSVSFVNKSGFNKIYLTYIGQFFMFLNWNFWKYTMVVFTARWRLLCCSRFMYVLLPFYCIICTIELALCVAINALPIVSFGFTILNAYARGMSPCVSRGRSRVCIWTVKLVLNIVLIACVLYFLFIFCSICFDACLFITRVLMFTYTGIIIYPKESYGYLIFTVTVLYYLVECANNFSITYRKLLETSIRVCERVQRANGQSRFVDKNSDCKGVEKLLFDQIVEIHCPKRKLAFVSLLKLGLIIGVLWISLKLLRKTDRFLQLNTLVHVGTALFTCALPTIFMKLCRSADERYKQRLLKRDIMKTVQDYASYLRAPESGLSELSSD